MGYHTYDLTEFSLDAVGEHATYLFLFTQNEQVRYNFAEAIGCRAVSVSDRVTGIDWCLLPGMPEYLTEHAVLYATIVVICPTREAARRFLAKIKDLREWRRGAAATMAHEAIPGIDLAHSEEIAIVALPRSVDLRHDAVLRVLAELVCSGLAREAVLEGKREVLAARLQALSGVRVVTYASVIVSETADAIRKPAAERYGKLIAETLSELKDLKADLAAIPQSRDTNRLLSELADIRKRLSEDREKGTVSLQASIGLEAFGNGIKVVADSGGMSLDRLKKFWEVVRKLRAVEDEVREAGA